ncbi:glycosyltransferase [Pedobacter sp. HMF7647]|uniref:Glycosyltransferase n=1 Tax=Hufsiella arboris TaxID=2695275 RepID=A0A7K1Y609_9SPHI|nr:glycosyltransferase family 2 protein [Hufsiella arboris]MXV50016.1 glycosyltransferase [Hufsiella arboris]
MRVTCALLISTYNWPEALELVLRSVLQQSRMPDEILIADDGSGRPTIDLVNKYRDAFPVPLKHAWIEDIGFRKSLALNKAIKMAHSDYIIEVDGDIILHPRFVEDHMKAAKKGFFVQGSRTMLNQKKSEEILQTKQVKFSPFTKGIYSRFNSFRIPFLSILFQPDPKDSYNAKACNIAFWRKDYVQINGYYNDFEGWGCEDYEFAARLINSGIYKKRLKMAAIGYHIFHKHYSRHNLQSNDVIYQRTLKEKLTYCINGYQEAE